MKRLSYSIVAVIVWFSLLFNLAWLVSPFQISPFLNIFLPVCSVVVILVLRKRKLPSIWLFGVTFVIYGALKYQFGFKGVDTDLGTIVSEVTALMVTLILSILIGQRLEELRTTLSNLVIGTLDEDVEPFELGQSALYREVRRARRHHHSLALLAIAAPKVPVKMSDAPAPTTPFPNHVVVDLQRELGNRYLLILIGRLLIDKLGDSAIVTLAENHFVVVLPETSSEELQTILQQFQSAAEDKLGFQLQIGVATFPDQEITFDALLARAKLALQVASAPSNFSVANHKVDAIETQLEMVSLDRNNVPSV